MLWWSLELSMMFCLNLTEHSVVHFRYPKFSEIAKVGLVGGLGLNFGRDQFFKCKYVHIFISFPAVMDLTFLVMLILRDGLCYGIFVYDRPLWLDIIFPFGIVPVFYMLRFCTSYMLVVISIERCMALSNLLGYKTKCYSYIFLVVLFSSELIISWNFFINTYLEIYLF